jgi:hypothetical protein
MLSLGAEVNTMQNGTASSSNGSAQHRFEGLKEGLKTFAHRFDSTPEGYLGKLENQIKAHPIAAVGIAFGIGYVAMRIFRR